MTDTATLNGAGTTPAPTNPFATLAAVNLDEMKPPTTYTLRFTERGAAYEVEGADGQKVTRYHEDTEREVKITSRVPNALFIEFLRTIWPRLSNLKEDPLAGSYDLMAEAVLLKWQLHEPEMTLERLQYGLEPEVIAKLFADFFGGRLLLLR